MRVGGALSDGASADVASPARVAPSLVRSTRSRAAVARLARCPNSCSVCSAHSSRSSALRLAHSSWKSRRQVFQSLNGEAPVLAAPSAAPSGPSGPVGRSYGPPGRGGRP